MKRLAWPCRQGVDYILPALPAWRHLGFPTYEDLAIGTGPVAARGRRLTADIDVRYTDVTAIYRGTIISYPGFSRLVGNILRRSPNSAYFLVLNDRESRHSAIFLSAGYALFDGLISI